MNLLRGMRYCSVIFLMLVLAGCGMVRDNIGYFYLSGHFESAEDIKYSKDEQMKLRQKEMESDYSTDIHGPFRSKLKARIDMKRRMEDSEKKIYFTKIFRL